MATRIIAIAAAEPMISQSTLSSSGGSQTLSIVYTQIVMRPCTSFSRVDRGNLKDGNQLWAQDQAVASHSASRLRQLTNLGQRNFRDR